MKKVLLIVCFFFTNVCFASNATDIIAEVLIDLEHFPNETDISFLDDVIADEESTGDEKALAKIIRRIQHKPEVEDVGELIRLSRGKNAEIRLLADAVLSVNHQVAADKKAELEAMLGE